MRSQDLMKSETTASVNEKCGDILDLEGLAYPISSSNISTRGLQAWLGESGFSCEHRQKQRLAHVRRDGGVAASQLAVATGPTCLSAGPQWLLQPERSRAFAPRLRRSPRGLRGALWIISP